MDLESAETSEIKRQEEIKAVEANGETESSAKEEETQAKAHNPVIAKEKVLVPEHNMEGVGSVAQRGDISGVVRTLSTWRKKAEELEGEEPRLRSAVAALKAWSTYLSALSFEADVAADAAAAETVAAEDGASEHHHAHTDFYPRIETQSMPLLHEALEMYAEAKRMTCQTAEDAKQFDQRPQDTASPPSSSNGEFAQLSTLLCLCDAGEARVTAARSAFFAWQQRNDEIKALKKDMSSSRRPSRARRGSVNDVLEAELDSGGRERAGTMMEGSPSSSFLGAVRWQL